MKLLRILLLNLSIIAVNVQTNDRLENLEKEVADLKTVLSEKFNEPRFWPKEKYEEYLKQVEIDNQNALVFLYGSTKIVTSIAVIFTLSAVIYKKYCEKYGKKINENVYEHLKALSIGSNCVAGVLLWISACMHFNFKS